MCLIRAGYGFVDAELRRDVAVLVRGDRIAEVGSFAALRAAHPDLPVYGGEQYALLPGFVNSHDHGRAIGTLAGGSRDDVLEVWLNSLAGQPALPPRLSVRFEGVNLARAGVTATAHSHNPRTWQGMFDELPETLAGYADAGIRVALHPPIVDQNLIVYGEGRLFAQGLPPSLREQVERANSEPPLSVEAYFEALSALYDQHHDEAGCRVHIQVSPAGGQWCSDSLLRRAHEWARERGTRVQMHMLETRLQRLYAWRTWGTSFIAHLEAIGILDESLTLAHMIWLDEGDVERLRAAGVGVAHNPSSNLRLRSGIASAAALIAAGVRVGIGLDGHALDDDQDFGRELRLARMLANLDGWSSVPPVRAEALLYAGTAAGAAVTFGADAPLGRLAVGQFADLILVDWAALRGAWLPDQLPGEALAADLLVQRLCRAHVRDVMVAGEWIVRDGRHTRIDEAALYAEVRAALEPHVPDTGETLVPFIRAFYKDWV